MLNFKSYEAKRLLNTGEVRSLLKNVKTDEQLSCDMFKFMAKNQKVIGFDILIIFVNLPPDITTGEILVTVQVGGVGDQKKYQKKYELSYSNRLKIFNVNDNEDPDLLEK